jgi:hypothetical protein
MTPEDLIGEWLYANRDFLPSATQMVCNACAEVLINLLDESGYIIVKNTVHP